ncbi:hypothetical protein [Bartonella queenslandensis]|uniref:hypothetical protein n=1 Tax=Bartonella queenslandensis TaxID=481138 RepID=UPI001FCB008B|nr:hypothetical protein [Bartonella queenslandensis]
MRSEFADVDRKVGEDCVASDCKVTAEFGGVFSLEDFVDEVGAPERLLDFTVSVVVDCVVRVSCVAVRLGAVGVVGALGVEGGWDGYWLVSAFSGGTGETVARVGGVTL